MINVLVVLVLMAARAAGPHAEQPSLWLAGAEMVLGTPRDKVLGALGPQYKTTHWDVDTGDILHVLERRDDQWKDIGFVAFTGGRLSLISRDWDVSDDTGPSMAEALVGAIESVMQGTKSAAAVSTTSGRTPDMKLDSIDIAVGRRTVHIIVSSGKNGKSVTIQETLGER